MSNHTYYTPVLKKAGAHIDWRSEYPGGFGWRGDRPLNQVRKIVIHHTDTNRSGDARKDVNLIKTYHVDRLRWGGIGYHFLVTSDNINGFAKVAYIGDIGSIRAHAPDTKGAFSPAGHGNYYYIGISIVGRLSQHRPTDEQIRSVHELCKELIYGEDNRLPQLKTWDQSIVGHNQTDWTECPGKKWNYLSEIKNPPKDKKQMEEIEKLKKQVASKDKKIRDLDKKYKNALKQIDAATRELKKANESLTSVNNTLALLGEENADLKNKITECKGEIKAFEQKIDKVIKDAGVKNLSEIPAKIRQLSKENEEIKSSSAFKVANFLLSIFDRKSKK